MTTTTKPKPNPGNSDDIAFIKSHQADFDTVTAGITDIQTQVGTMAANATQDEVNQLAISAQQLHDSLDSIHNDFASTDLSTGAVEVFTASGELRDAMDALVNYTGNPNPKSLAGFTTQYQTAVTDWNQGVSDLWSSAKETTPPTIAVGP